MFPIRELLFNKRETRRIKARLKRDRERERRKVAFCFWPLFAAAPVDNLHSNTSLFSGLMKAFSGVRRSKESLTCFLRLR